MKHTLLLSLLVCSLAFCLGGCEEDAAPQSVKPTLTTGEATVNGRFAASITGTISMAAGTQVESAGFIYSKVSTLPDNDTESVKVPITLNGISGTYTASVSGLESDTRYYYCLYAQCGRSSVRSEIKMFQTAADGVPLFAGLTYTGLTANSVTLVCEMTDNGGHELSLLGFCYNLASEGSEPDANDNTLNVSDTKQTRFTATLQDLKPNTSYRIRAYGINSKGTGYSSESLLVTTENAAAPTPSAIKCTEPGAVSLTVQASIVDAGTSKVTEMGFCWSKETSEPTTSMGLHRACEPDANGEFSTTITELDANSTYYIRAYAVNAQGTGYGEVFRFNTTEEKLPPTLSTVTASAVTETSMHLEATITSDGNSDVTKKGFYVSTSPADYGVEHTVTTVGNSLVYDLTGLTLGTTYYIHAYAVNALGTTYSDALTITTPITLPQLSAVTVSRLQNTSAQVQASVGNQVSLHSYGFELSTDELPAGTFGTGSTLLEGEAFNSANRSFIRQLEGLQPNTRYYIRAWAKRPAPEGSREEDFYGLGEAMQFTTPSNVTPGTDIEDIPNHEW